MDKKFRIAEGSASVIKRPLVEIIGNRRVLIENHTGITEFGNERITASNTGGNVVVTGRDLQITLISEEQIVIVGKIGSVLLDEGI